MTESKRLHFADADMRLYGRLDAAGYDLGLVTNYAGYILKKGWRAKPWSRGSTYLQQSAFITAMIASYGRAFGRSNGWPPLPGDLLLVYNGDEMREHKAVLTLRDQVYAHSDSVGFRVVPYKSTYHSDIQGRPFLELSLERVKGINEMSAKISKEIGIRMRAIKDKYP